MYFIPLLPDFDRQTLSVGYFLFRVVLKFQVPSPPFFPSCHTDGGVPVSQLWRAFLRSMFSSFHDVGVLDSFLRPLRSSFSCPSCSPKPVPFSALPPSGRSSARVRISSPPSASFSPRWNSCAFLFPLNPSHLPFVANHLTIIFGPSSACHRTTPPPLCCLVFLLYCSKNLDFFLPSGRLLFPSLVVSAGSFPFPRDDRVAALFSTASLFPSPLHTRFPPLVPFS